LDFFPNKPRFEEGACAEIDGQISIRALCFVYLQLEF